MRFTYVDDLPLAEKADAVARRVYGADRVTFTSAARKALDRIEAEGHGSLPVCMAKTQSSFSTDPACAEPPPGTPSTSARCGCRRGPGSWSWSPAT